jgi:DNA helicase II / ATP-dependent DNA helicase PcrA
MNKDAGRMEAERILQRLNPAQRAAVEHIDGPLLILAGPGSGKTRVVTHRIAHMLASGVAPQQILAVTFTNKAAAEMRHRLQAMVGPAPVQLGTFHGLCASLLRRYANLVGLTERFTIYDTDDAKQALRKAVETTSVGLTHVSLDGLARAISQLKNRLVSADMLHSSMAIPQIDILMEVYPAYQRVLLANGAADFDDLLLHVATLLRQSDALRAELDRRWRYVMVDEYQDTNLAQYVIVRGLSIDHPNLAVTGDPDQSIYGWRGADLNNILNFERDYPDVRVVRLEENYRSTPEILSLADCLIGHNQLRKAKRLLATRPGGQPVRLATYNSAREEAQRIAEQISLIGREQPNELSEVAILYRTNSHSRLLEQALLACRIPYQLIGGFRFYQRQEVKDLLAYLRLINNTADDVAFTRAVNVPPRGLGPKSLAQIEQLGRQRSLPMLAAARGLMELGQLPPKAKRGLQQFFELYDALSRMADQPLVKLLQELLRATDYRQYIATKKLDQAGESAQGNIDELLADAAAVDQQPSPQPALERFLEQVALAADTDQWDSQAAKVSLMTLHAAKGLEFSRVYIIAVEEGVLPHVRAKESATGLEEERRLLFVGMTRAKDWLQLSYARQRGFSRDQSGVASQFLLELPRAEMQLIDDDRDVWPQHFGSYTGFDDSSQLESGQAIDEPPEIAYEGNPHRPIGRRRSVAADAWDETSQLPPEELLARLQRHSPGRSSTPSHSGRLRLATELPEAEPTRGYRVGASVEHPTYGRGEVIRVRGRGHQQTVSVSFAGEQRPVSFRTAHAPLRLVDPAP